MSNRVRTYVCTYVHVPASAAPYHASSGVLTLGGGGGGHSETRTELCFSLLVLPWV